MFPVCETIPKACIDKLSDGFELGFDGSRGPFDRGDLKKKLKILKKWVAGLGLPLV